MDAKLIEKYGIAVSESTRGRRKRLGKANLQYLRHDHFFIILAMHRSVANLARAFYEIPFEPYAPVRRQMLLLLRKVNQVRKRAGYQLVPAEILPFRRRVVKPFSRIADLLDVQRA